MHHLSLLLLSRKKGPVKDRSGGCQDLVRFFALLRIKPHAPPLVRVPVNSFEFHSPGGILNALAAAPKNYCSPTPSIHRLRRGLPGYLILFAPHAFEPQRQWSSSKSSVSVTVQQAAFATGVPPNIYAFHRYTRNSACLSCTLAMQFQMQLRG